MAARTICETGKTDENAVADCLQVAEQIEFLTGLTGLSSSSCDAPASVTARAYVTMSAVLLDRSAFTRSCAHRSQHL
jgi:hypothetical protein